MSIQICGRVAADPMAIWRKYAKAYPRTILEYDLAGQGNPEVLTEPEAWRSRKLNSRLTSTERRAVVTRALHCPWNAVPADADLTCADPLTPDGLFAKAAGLYWTFTYPERIRGVRPAKVHKILHIKRPGLYPILDRRIRVTYQPWAAAWTERLAHLDGITDTDAPPYWAAFRDDLIRNLDELARSKEKLSQDEDEEVRLLAKLTAVRLQDIIAWWIAPG